MAQSPKIVADCTVSFSITEEGKNDPVFKNAVKTLYLKGKLIRTDLESPAFNQSVIYDDNTGTAVVLKEIGANKYITTLSEAAYKKQNERFEGMQLVFENESKTILGYECKKATAKLKDGSSFSVFYATAIIPSAPENPYQFKNIPGFVLEYESRENGKTGTITYTATKINLSPVPASRFEIPSKGYRVL